MNAPKTVKQTTRTRTVEVCGMALKIKIIKGRIRLSGFRQKSEAQRMHATTRFDCEALGLFGLRRIEMEKAIWAIAGIEVGNMTESKQEWKL